MQLVDWTKKAVERLILRRGFNEKKQEISGVSGTKRSRVRRQGHRKLSGTVARHVRGRYLAGAKHQHRCVRCTSAAP